MIRGYGRVSTDGQRVELQRDTLLEAGADVLYLDTGSDSRWDRPELRRLLEDLEQGDQVVVWKLDRVARSLQDLLRFLEAVEAAGAGFRCLTQPIDTTTSAGRLQAQLIGAFAEFERSLIRERTTAGLQAARARGVQLGRPRALSSEQVAHIRHQIETGAWTKAEAARVFGVHRSTIGRALDS